MYFHNLSESGYWFERSLRRALKIWKGTLNEECPTIVDFGCGAKPFQKLFSDIKCNYIGLDVYDGSAVDLVYDGVQIPLEDDCVALVFSVSVFEHVADIENSLSEIARILKPGGSLIAVVPFINHLHGIPYDYHRPTRHGWQMLLKRAFGNAADISVDPVDTRLVCLGNTITAQINFMLFDSMRLFKPVKFSGENHQLSLYSGGASPESASNALKLAYYLLKINPINFLIGFFCWSLSWLPSKRRVEGEITSGYCMSVVLKG
jgi:SAM-dependent methyltransferase